MYAYNCTNYVKSKYNKDTIFIRIVNYNLNLIN